MCHAFSYVAGDNATEAASAAQQADVSIVFVATSSSEGSDRTSLNLDNGGDDLIQAVVAATQANETKKVVVVAVTPGALLTPWADSVAAVLVPFVPGQECVFLAVVPQFRLTLLNAFEGEAGVASAALKVFLNKCPMQVR